MHRYARPTLSKQPALAYRPHRDVRAAPAQRRSKQDTIEAIDLAPVVDQGPYVDYARRLTREGGVLITFKDLDLRWRYTLWRVVAWSVFSIGTGWTLYHYSPLAAHWLDGVAFLLAGLVNWLILRKPVEVYRRIEIRADCLILEGADVFWLERMQGRWPELYPDTDGNYILSGIYGTRFVEYATLRRFDDFDRMPEVFAEHVEDAMQQLWGRQSTRA